MLLDTNVLSEVLRRQPSLAVMRALHALRPEQRCASEVTRNVRHFNRVPGLVVESWFPE